MKNIMAEYNKEQREKHKAIRHRMMSNYHSGRGLEYELKALFESAGWSIMRGSSSKGEVLEFKADLVASKFTDKIKRTAYMVLVQAKRQTIRGKNAVR